MTLKRSLAILAVAGGTLVTAARAGAAITYSGHGGLGSSAYQHNQTELDHLALSPQGPGMSGIHDGISNTVMFGIAADGQGADYIAMPDMDGQWYRTAVSSSS